MKYYVFASLVILSVNVSWGQTKLGLKLSPAILHQRIAQSSDTVSISKGANPFNLSIALFADLPLSKNYYFTTGIGYTSKRINLQRQSTNDYLVIEKIYNVQYVRIPATLKLYTNEVALDKKLYVQFGPLVDVAVHTKENNSTINTVQKFQPVDVSLLFAAGLQIQLAPQTAIQVGASYTRGLVNIVKSTSGGLEGLKIKNDLYALDFAVKF
jgi:hypothetical protein